MKNSKKFCVFCGLPPRGKNKEHVLPQWLIGMTGDPKRVVNICSDYSKNKKTVRFDWTSLVAPACYNCNEDFSQLENLAKDIVLRLQMRESLPVHSYLWLLDWLDKVRIGVWLTFQQLDHFPIEIDPQFHIESRMGRKDRMLALYTFDSEKKGLNAIATDSFIFKIMPSCFALRINDILIINASSDYLCSEMCGFPFPQAIEMIHDGPYEGMLSLGNFTMTGRIQHPISKFQWIKPTVSIFQPIMLPTSDPTWNGGFLGSPSIHNRHIKKHLIKDRIGRGILFRQHTDRVVPLYNMNDLVILDEVSHSESSTFACIAAQVYEYQIELFKAIGCPNLVGANKMHHENVSKAERMFISDAQKWAEIFRGQTD